jgi:adenine-specific DNA glycosylase
MAKETYDSAMAAWKKYGFYEKAENFKKSFGQALEL